MLQVNYEHQKTLSQLKELEKGLEGKAIRLGLTQSIRPILAQMKRTVPVGEGYLKKAIGRLTISKRAKQRLGIPSDTIAILLGANKKVLRKDKTKASQRSKAIFEEWGVAKKNRPADPFMAPALESNIESVENNFYNGLQAYINKVSS